jgi:selenocysteine lyase/cysteine desulfurase
VNLATHVRKRGKVGLREKLANLRPAKRRERKGLDPLRPTTRSHRFCERMSVAPGEAMRREHFAALDSNVHFLNHGSFGVSPKSVMAARNEILLQVERNADLFCRHQVQREFATVMRQLAPVLHLESPQSLVFVDNATSGVQVAICGALRHLRRLHAQDEIVLVDFSNTYNACQIIVAELAAAQANVRHLRVRLGASGCALELSEDEVVELTRAAIAGLANARVVLLVDHITSITGALMPVARIASMARQLGATVIIDGAHAIGQVDIDLSQLECDFYVSNLHKWLYTPRGCALLHTVAAFQADTFPLLISHHHVQPYQKRFLMQATRDESRWLSVPAALTFVREIGGGFDRIWAYQREFLERSCARLVREWGTRVAFAPERFRAMALVELPPIGVLGAPLTDARAFAFCSLLFRRWKVVVPVPLIDGKLYVRISAQIYSADADIDGLARAVAEARAATTLSDIGFDDTRNWVEYEW